MLWGGRGVYWQSLDKIVLCPPISRFVIEDLPRGRRVGVVSMAQVDSDILILLSIIGS